MSTNDEKPATLTDILLEDEKDQDIKAYFRSGLKVVDPVVLDAEDIKQQGNLDEVVLPGKDAVDYSDIKLDAAEEKAEVHMAPVVVSTKPSNAEDDLDFDAMTTDTSNEPIGTLDPTIIELLTRRTKGDVIFRFSELFSLIQKDVENESTEGLQKTEIQAVHQKLSFGYDDQYLFDQIPGANSVDEAANVTTDSSGSVSSSTAALASQSWAHSLLEEPSKPLDLLDKFKFRHKSKKELLKIRKKFVELGLISAESLQAHLKRHTDNKKPTTFPPQNQKKAKINDVESEIDHLIADSSIDTKDEHPQKAKPKKTKSTKAARKSTRSTRNATVGVDSMDIEEDNLESASVVSSDAAIDLDSSKDAYDLEDIESWSDEETEGEASVEVPYLSPAESDRLFAPVQHTPWELDILWDVNDTTVTEVVDEVGKKYSEDGMDTLQQDADADDGMESSNMDDGAEKEDAAEQDSLKHIEDDLLVESVYLPPKAICLPGQYQLLAFSSKPNSAIVENLQSVTASNNLDEYDPNSSSIVVVEKDFVAPTVNKLVYSSFPSFNRDLEIGDWIENIVWDDEDIGQKRKLAPIDAKVEVDMTDVYMLFEEEGAVEHEEPAEGSNVEGNQEPVKKQIRKRHLQLPSRVLKSGEVLKSKQDALKQIDKFNLSRDAYYLEGSQAKAREKKSATLQHSPYALKNVLMRRRMTVQQLRNFHRPSIFLSAKYPVYHILPHSEMVRDRKKKGITLDIMKRKRDLSARDGRIILLEYTEQYPPLLMDIGMASRITNYIRKEAVKEDTPLLPFMRKEASENDPLKYVNAVGGIPTTSADNIPFQDGEDVVLDPFLDKLPFLGDIQPGSKLQAVHNNLFRAVIFRHPPESSDFLLIRQITEIKGFSPYGSGNPAKSRSVTANSSITLSHQQQQIVSAFFVREIPAIYVVGQQEPERVVPAPNSRQSSEFVKTRIQQFVNYLFMKAYEEHGEPASIKLTTVTSYFPQSDNAVRKSLKQCAEYQRGGDGSWVFKDRSVLPLEEEIQNMASLDEVCAYECQLAVATRLQDLGIEAVTLSSALHRIVKSLYDRHDPKFPIARYIAEELELASWNLTNNFIDSHNSKSILQLKGLGDPSGCGQAYSYLRLPMKIQGLKKDKEREATITVTGTDRDLRKLNLLELKEKLLEFQVPEEHIKSLPRWTQVNLLRHLANQRKKADDDEGDAMLKYARYSKHNVATHQDEYNKRVQQIFFNQIQALKYNPEEEEEESAEFFSALGGTPSLAGDDQEDETAEEREKEEIEKYINFVNSLETTKAGDDSDTEKGEDNDKDSSRPQTPSATSQAESQSSSTTVTTLLEESQSLPVVLGPNGLPSQPGTYVKIISTLDGFERVTWSQDPKLIAEAKNRSKKTSSTKLVTDDEKRSKRSEQERLRRQKQKLLKQRAAAGLPTEGIDEELAEIKSTGKVPTCSRCKQPGHMKTNSICPLYSTLEEDSDHATPAKSRSRSKGRRRKHTLDSDEEEEFLEEEWPDDGDETPEEDFDDNVGIAAQRQTVSPRPEVVSAGGTKFVFKGLSDTSRRAAKRKRTAAQIDDYYHFGDDTDDDAAFEAFANAQAQATTTTKKRAVKPKIAADSPQGEFNLALKPSWENVIHDVRFELFKTKVDKTIFFDYYDLIKEPMWMDLIGTKLRQFQYTSVQQYLNDWDLLRNNCYLYNQEANPSIPPYADLLYDTVKESVTSIAERLDLMEAAIRAGSTSSGAPPNNPSESVVQTQQSNTQVDEDMNLDVT